VLMHFLLIGDPQRPAGERNRQARPLLVAYPMPPRAESGERR
jgi:hypothetical protein